MEAGSSTANRQRTAQPSTPRRRCARPREISRTPAVRPPQRASAGGDRTGVRVKEVAPLGAAASEVAFLIPATRRSQTMRDVFRSCSKHPPRGFLRFSSKLHCCCVFMCFFVLRCLVYTGSKIRGREGGHLASGRWSATEQ